MPWVSPGSLLSDTTGVRASHTLSQLSLRSEYRVSLRYPSPTRLGAHFLSRRSRRPERGGISGSCRSIGAPKLFNGIRVELRAFNGETWSPQGWFDDQTCETVARSFANPDWLPITLSSYRGRWRCDEPRDVRYDPLHDKIASVGTLSVPTLMIQGGEDGTVLPESSEDSARFFRGSYRRVVLPGVGHFPSREAPGAVADLIIQHCRNTLPG